MKTPRLIVALFVVAGCASLVAKESATPPSAPMKVQFKDASPSAATSVAQFQGMYANMPAMRYQSVSGVYNGEYLQDSFGCPSYLVGKADRVKISVTADTLQADIQFGNGTVKQYRFALGKECTFKDGTLSIPVNAATFAGHPIPTGYMAAGEHALRLGDDHLPRSLEVSAHEAGARKMRSSSSFARIED